MKNQIYIFLAVILFFNSCKKDSPEVEPKNLLYWVPDKPLSFSRENTIVDYNSDVLSPIKVRFESEQLIDKTYNFNLILTGGDSLLFATQGGCFQNFKPNDLISDSLLFQPIISLYQVEKGDTICNPTDTLFIAFKRSYHNNHRTTFGWFRITRFLGSYFQLDKMGWNYANHQPVRVEEKNK